MKYWSGLCCAMVLERVEEPDSADCCAMNTTKQAKLVTDQWSELPVSACIKK